MAEGTSCRVSLKNEILLHKCGGVHLNLEIGLAITIDVAFDKETAAACIQDMQLARFVMEVPVDELEVLIAVQRSVGINLVDVDVITIKRPPLKSVMRSWFTPFGLSFVRLNANVSAPTPPVSVSCACRRSACRRRRCR